MSEASGHSFQRPVAPECTAVEQDIQACLAAFKVLAAHVRAIIADVESAVAGVSSSFGGIASRARQSVATAATTLGATDDGLQGNGATALATTQDAMDRVVEVANRAPRRVAQKMESVEGQMHEVGATAAEVEGLANGIRLLGLNASIEAARAGCHGRTFAVVATKTKELGQEAAVLNKTMQRTLKRLVESVHSTSVELHLAATAEVDTIRREVNRAVDALLENHDSMRKSLQCSAEASELLAADISQAVVTMQFQDRVSQRLHHVADGIDELGRRLASHVPADGAGTAPDWATDFLALYTMDQERCVHHSIDGSGQNSADNEAGSIELF